MTSVSNFSAFTAWARLYTSDGRARRLNQPCRIYAPVGSHEDLLAYLVRRLLENGANTSFVNRLADDEAPIEEIIADPVKELVQLSSIPHPRIPLPRDLFAPRRNSGATLCGMMRRAQNSVYAYAKGIRGRSTRRSRCCGKAGAGGQSHSITAPHDRRMIVGQVGRGQRRRCTARPCDAAQPRATRLGSPRRRRERAEILERRRRSL